MDVACFWLFSSLCVCFPFFFFFASDDIVLLSLCNLIFGAGKRYIHFKNVADPNLLLHFLFLFIKRNGQRAGPCGLSLSHFPSRIRLVLASFLPPYIQAATDVGSSRSYHVWLCSAASLPRQIWLMLSRKVELTGGWGGGVGGQHLL